jgi:hypothetical protein
VTQFRYADIERQIVEALPEIRPAAEFYWRTEGEAGKDCGPYIFFEDLFGRYVEVLLWLPPEFRRDELLRRAFEVVEQMLDSADGHVRDLAAIGLYEGRGPAWLARAHPFVGARGRACLNEEDPFWDDRLAAKAQGPPEILDGYHAREVVARELHLPLNQVPGKTYATGSLDDTGHL